VWFGFFQMFVYVKQRTST